MYVCYNQRTWSLWHDLCDINAHLIFPPFPILYWNCFTISIKRNKVKVILGCRKPSTFLFWSQQWDINASRLTHSWPSPNADCIDSLNSRLPHYNISQSSVICSVVSYRWSSIYYHTSIFSDQENLSFAAVCLFFPFSFLLHLPNVPLWKTQAINCAIKTHGHNFLTCFSASLPRCIWTSSVKVFGWNGRWMGPNVLLHAFELTTTPPFSLHITNALPHYCHHCHSNTKNIWAPVTSPQHRAKNSVCSSLLLRVRPTGVVKKRCKARFQTTYGSQILLIKLKLSLLLDDCRAEKISWSAIHLSANTLTFS